MKAIESNDEQPGAQKKLGLNSESAWGTQVAEPDRWLPTRDSLPDEGRGPANKNSQVVLAPAAGSSRASVLRGNCSGAGCAGEEGNTSPEFIVTIG
jgi:hypothetical protein